MNRSRSAGDNPAGGSIFCVARVVKTKVGSFNVASNCFTILDIFHCKINEISDVNSFILFLGVMAVILGVPIYWTYIVLWHFIFEKNKMQKEEVSWLDEKIVLTKETIFHFSNLIWHYIDIKTDHEGFA